MTTEQYVWAPSAADREAANVSQFMRWLEAHGNPSFTDYHELWAWTVEELESFWAAVWDYYRLRQVSTYSEVLSARRMPGAQWFVGAELNYAEEVLRRAPATGPALVSVDEDGAVVGTTRDELSGRVGALAGFLRELGVEPGDRVAAYIPNIEAAVVALLASAAVGAVWCACAPDFGERGVLDRFTQVEPKVLFAVDGYRFKGKDHDRAATVARLRAALPGATTVLVRDLDPSAPLPAGAVAYDELIAAPRPPELTPVPFAHPLWILFSSGTTGPPKGIVQGHGGILVEHLKSLGLCMDLRPGDRFFFHSSVSWMAWNWLVGGLLHGATPVLYNGSPAAHRVGSLWEIAAAAGASVLGLGSAYVAQCQKDGVDLGATGVTAALRLVNPTGSPLAESGWRWLAAQLGPRVRIDSTCGGTDVCTAFFGGSPLLPVRAGEIPCRWLGVDADAVDPAGSSLRGQVGQLVLRSPLPSMPLALWRDDDGSRYRATYLDSFPGLWDQGDWIVIGDDGGVRVNGRSDATLNRGGVRIGPAEVYGAVEDLEEVVDSLVVGVDLPDGGYAMPLFVTLRDGVELDDALRRRIATTIREQLTPRHVPDVVVAVPAIPRTLTGKKLEVPVKRILQGVAAKDAAAADVIDHPEALVWFESRRRGVIAAATEPGGGVRSS